MLIFSLLLSFKSYWHDLRTNIFLHFKITFATHLILIMSRIENSLEKNTDVVLIGAGIMSATLGVMLKQLEPDLTIEIFETLDVAAAESSDAWNNAGTGHSAFCELNYTPELPDGTVETKKAVKIAESFEVSKQFWSYLIEQNYVNVPPSFIRTIPHLSFVWGEKNVKFLWKRFEAHTSCHLFKGMKYTEDKTLLSEWIPLVMEGREPEEKVAATRMDIGTDVNFGFTYQMYVYSFEKTGGC